ncbi:MAG: sodium:solute symporter [Saprospiraceae bacterium]|nr:sodium:solute symporter [Saprospiraceae bacterium]MBK8450147.1 sodium:solute symporter [Saprospiraceae bacterium]MBK9721859.1 sodium:solute symporter [Saprospiraceae bacterium]
MLSSSWLIFILLIYFGLLLWIARITSKDHSNESFFVGKRNSKWYVVAFGMIGTSLSGVTFISVPGTVGANGFFYFQVVLGYFIGYVVVAYVLLPIYYSLQLTSIYHFLEKRLGLIAYKTGASYFILSRTIGATARLYLVINVLQLFLLNDLGVSFYVTALFILLMILLYTLQGGVKTIVWTDTLQTFFMLTALVCCIWMILNALDISLINAIKELDQKSYLNIFNTDLNSGSNFWKHFIGGALITISMTGMDQEMMQKNISVRTLKDSQKNMMFFSVVLIFVNLLFLFLGGLLYLFAKQYNLELAGDDIFPSIALQHMPIAFSLLFIIGLISALFPSADGAITALTAAFCIDILGFNRKEDKTEEQKIKIRKTVHYLFALVFLILVFIFKWIDNKSIIDVILKVAGYTYGPLLGLFSFAILTKRVLPDNFRIILVCLIAPILVFIIDLNSKTWFGGFSFGYLNLGLNGLITFIGLLLISKSKA